MDIFNEACTIALVDLLLIFSEGNTRPVNAHLDILFLVALFSNIVVHLYFLIKSSIVDVKLKCKRKCIHKGWCCYGKSKKVKKAIKKGKGQFDDEPDSPRFAAIEIKNRRSYFDLPAI